MDELIAKVSDAYNHLRDTYNACQDFEKNISKPFHGNLSHEQVQTDKQLNWNYYNAIIAFANAVDNLQKASMEWKQYIQQNFPLKKNID